MDLPLLRVRRGIEWAGLIGRSVSMLWILGSLVLWSLPVTTALWATPLALTNLLAWYALRNATRPRYAVLNALEIAADTATVIGTVLALSGSSDAVLWPIFVIAIIVGAVRGRLAGALLTWLATTTGCITLYVWSGPIAGRPMPDDLVGIAPALHLVVAILTGLLAQGHRTQLRRLAEARAELRRLALHDPLTGLGNRHLLEEFTRAGLTPGAPTSVLMLDLDGFKEVNDTLGHAAGDELLRVVGARLRGHARDGDLVARLGGDEFVLLLPGASAEVAAEVAARLRFAVIAPVSIDGRPVRIDASVGTATASGGTLDALLRAADTEMYREKAGRRRQAAHAA